ncbi:membrane-associated protein, putative [Bodo saltans]|uniref:Membrane-associated protein, putative n=1 Tax=Bodo saltans TaxID=75058 RepID=A0A0S4IUE5_BODSA|nr:membrane-associated protein, putative [Bodo saltans]|eukprot:CUG10165.1 membrane-associated protein, putative [Bodo saltans]
MNAFGELKILKRSPGKRRRYLWMSLSAVVLMMLCGGQLLLLSRHGRHSAADSFHEIHRESESACPPPTGVAASWRIMEPAAGVSKSALRSLFDQYPQHWGAPNSDPDIESFALHIPSAGSSDDAMQTFPTIGTVLQRSSGTVRLSLSIYQRKLKRSDFEYFSMNFVRPDIMRATNASCDVCYDTRTAATFPAQEDTDVTGRAAAAELAQSLNHVIVWQVLRSGGPRLLYLHSILNPSFCSQLIAMANKTLSRSTVMFDRSSDGKTEGSQLVHQVRTSSGTFLTSHADRFSPANTALRVAASYVLGVPESFLEPTQILQYHAGQYYVPHLDYFELEGVHRGGQRVATVLVWLSDVACGGETAFPAARVQLRPAKGDGVIFFNVQGGVGLNPDPASLHAGQPPRGTNASNVKWVAVLWAHPAEYKSS